MSEDIIKSGNISCGLFLKEMLHHRANELDIALMRCRAQTVQRGAREFAKTQVAQMEHWHARSCCRAERLRSDGGVCS
jgi:hypothetical protein